MSIGCEPIGWYSITEHSLFRTASSGLVCAAATIACSAQVDPPVYVAASAIATSPIGLEAIAAHTTPIYTASSALVGAASILSATGTTAPPVFTASITTTSSASILEAVGVFTVPVYTATVTSTTPGASLSSNATFDSGAFTASAGLSSTVSTLTATALFSSGSFEAVVVVILQPAYVTSTATTTPPFSFATVAIGIANPTITGLGTSTPPTYSAIVVLAPPASVLGGSAQFLYNAVTAVGFLTTPYTTLTGVADVSNPIYAGTVSLEATKAFINVLGFPGTFTEEIGLGRSPADILRYLIVKSGVTQWQTPETDTTNPFYVGFMPNSPNDAIVTYDVEGTADGRHQPTGHAWLHYGVTLVVRNDSYETAWVAMREILDYLDTQVLNTEVLIGAGEMYEVGCVNRQGTPYSLGQDPPKEGWIKLGVNLKAPIVQLVRRQ